MRKVLSLFISFILIICCLVGCDNNEQIDSSEPTNITESTSSTEPNVDLNAPDSEVLTESTIDEYVWEKNVQALLIETIKLDNNWDSEIVIGNSKVSAITATDISNTDNFYCDDPSLCGDLNAAYYTPKTGVQISTKFDQLDDDSCLWGQMILTCTTYKDNAIVENVRFVGVPDIFVNNGLGHIKDNAPYVANNIFGIGSEYSYVNSIIGEPDSKFDTTMEDGKSSTTCVYIGENVEMTLVFTWMSNDASDSGILTTIDWTPSTIRSALHSNIDSNLLKNQLVDEVEATVVSGE